MSVAKEKDLNKIPWFENCLIGQIFLEKKMYAIGYDLSHVDNEKAVNAAIIVNKILKEIILSR